MCNLIMAQKPNLKNPKIKIQNMNDQILIMSQQLDEREQIILQQDEQIKELQAIKNLLIKKISQQEKTITSLNETLKTKRPEHDTQDENKKKKSRNIAGWTVRKDSDGYYRAHKTINNKSYGAYVGKRIGTKTEHRLMEKERSILK